MVAGHLGQRLLSVHREHVIGEPCTERREPIDGTKAAGRPVDAHDDRRRPRRLRRGRDRNERQLRVVREVMGRASEMQRVAMATGASSPDHDEVDLLGLRRGEQLLAWVTLEQELPELHLRIASRSTPLVEQLGVLTAPRFDLLSEALRGGAGPAPWRR